MSVEFVLTRIDDRLIHGQVVVGWVKTVSPNVILVADDTAAEDSLQRSLMEMAATPAFDIEICKVRDIVSLCKAPAMEGKKILLLFSSTQAVVQAIECGLELKKINVGGIRFSSGKKQIMKAVAIDDQDRKNFQTLLSQGLEVTIQMVPTDEAIDIKRFLIT